jgi:hypothetical protein
MINDEWRDDNGINPDDDEALLVETGEFCKPQVAPRPSAKSSSKSMSKSVVSLSRPSSASALVGKSTSGLKRSMSDATSSQDAKPRKKAKKAAAT